MASPAKMINENDVLVKCDKDFLLLVLSRLKQHLPDHIWEYNTIYCYCHYYDYINTNRQTLISDAWNQRFYRPSFCSPDNCTLVSISGSKYYMIQAFTLEDSGNELLRCLRDTRRINWDNETLSLYCEFKHLPALICLAEKKIKHPTFNYQILVMHLTGEHIEQLNYDNYLTEDQFVAPLDSEKHSKLVDDFWRYKGNNTFEMIKQSIELNGGTGLFQHGNDEPICWITTDQRLAPGFLFTVELQRRKGYATLILAKELQRLWHKHLIGMYTLVDSSNTASLHLHVEMGFQQVNTLGCIDKHQYNTEF